LAGAFIVAPMSLAIAHPLDADYLRRALSRYRVARGP